MATVKRTSSKTKPWQVRWRDPAGDQRKRSYAKRVQADRFRTEVEHQLATAMYVDAAAGKVALRAYAEQWRLAQPGRHNTLQRLERDVRLHIVPALGDRPVAGVRPSEVQAWVTGLSERLSPASARGVFGTLRSIYRAARRDRLVGISPCDDITLPEVHQDEVVPLTVEQVETLAEVIDPRYRALVVLASGTGPRQGEAFGIRVEDLDFLRREVRVVQQIQVVTRQGPVVSPVKSRTSRRTIPAADSVLAELSQHLERYRHPKSDLVFTTPDGKALHRTLFNDQVWRPARKLAAERFRARARAERDPERSAELARRGDQLSACGVHDLRHWFASALIRYGIDVKTVSVRLGHSSPAVTLSTYAHLWPDAEDRTRAAVDTAFGHAPDPGVPTVRPGDLDTSAPAQVRGQK